MSNLKYSITPLLEIGPGAIKKAGALLKTLPRHQKALVVTDPGVSALGFFNEFLSGLSRDRIASSVFSEISPDPLEEEIVKGAKAAKEFGADIIIGIGGGSPMDAAKAIAILVTSKTPIDNLYGADKVTDGRLPLMLIPTTAGTGSEATPFAVITRPSGEKISITDQASVPDISLLDASLTIGLPKHLTAATGIDAIVHAIEAFTSSGNKTPATDRDALKAMELLWRSVPAAAENGSQMQARAEALEGAFYAGRAIANAPVGGIHALAYPLGGLHHIHHGLSNALLAGPVMRFNMEAAAPLYAQLAEAVLPTLKGGDEAKAEGFIKALEGMIKTTGLQTRLSQVGIKESDIPTLASEALKLERLLVNNPKSINQEQCEKIYRGGYA